MTKQIKPSEFAKVIQQDVERYRSAAVVALYDEAVKIINKSVRVTPFKNGDLRRSAFVSKPSSEGNEIAIELGYGGLASKYALAVHEMPKSNNFTEPGTGPKYLERPFDEAKRGQAKRLQANTFRRFLANYSNQIIYTANTEPK
jgi:hypothetical protein